jgi:hypothetical protein
MPPNARVVEFCRTERLTLLEPPPGTVQLELGGLTLEQGRQHLESKFAPVQPAMPGSFTTAAPKGARLGFV